MWLKPLLISMLLSSAVAWADIYKCPDGKGGLSFRQEPCPTGEAPIIKERNIRQKEEEAMRIGQLTLPKNYSEQIDKTFVQRLKDPASRQIAYMGKPYGSAVCGTINAKNSFGGYTGKQVFLAYFDETGELAHLEIYDDKRLNSVLFFGGLDATLIRQCGL
jgi:hypothetical protein